MKNIFKTFISCIVLAVGVTSCYDEMDSKSNIDAEYEQASNITASLGRFDFFGNFCKRKHQWNGGSVRGWVYGVHLC